MPDEPKPGETETPAKTFTQDEVNAIVAEERRKGEEKLASVTTERDAAVQEKTVLEQRTKEAGEQLTSAQREGLRYKVALEKGVPAALAGRLQGDDEAALVADAENLAGLLKPPEPGTEPTEAQRAAAAAVTDMGGGVRTDAEQPPSMNDLLRQAAGREPAPASQ